MLLFLLFLDVVDFVVDFFYMLILLLFSDVFLQMLLILVVVVVDFVVAVMTSDLGTRRSIKKQRTPEHPTTQGL